MLDRDRDARMWTAVGGMAGIACGIALIPFRSLTPASNLAFVFLILTMVIAEVGGRAAALVTAVVSALSLNFFLTEPYLTLTIEKTDDLVAFVALAIAGLVAAAFGRRRALSSQAASGARHDLDALDHVTAQLTAGAPLATVLQGMRQSFGLGGLALRGADGRVLAAAPPSSAALPMPLTALESRTLLATHDLQHRFGRRGLRLPEGGGRLPVVTDGEPLWLDLWEGNPEGLTVDDCRALAMAIAMLALVLRGDGPARPARDLY